MIIVSSSLSLSIRLQKFIFSLPSFSERTNLRCQIYPLSKTRNAAAVKNLKASVVDKQLRLLRISGEELLSINFYTTSSVLIITRSILIANIFAILALRERKKGEMGTAW